MKCDAFEVLWVARFDYAPGWMLKDHRHDYYQIIGVLDGAGEFCLNGTSHKIEPKKLFFILPNMTHGFINQTEHKIKTLDIKFLIHDLKIHRLIQQQDAFVLPFDPPVMEALQKIREEGLAKKPFYKTVLNTYLCEMVFLLLRQMCEQRNQQASSSAPYALYDTQSPFAKKIMSFLEAHYSSQLSLEKMAEYIGYNKYYFCEIFKKEFGETPIKFLYKYRIQRAMELISYSDYSFKEIADMTGFENVHHFSRIFKKTEALSPGQWRERERGGIRKGIYINDEFQKEP